MPGFPPTAVASSSPFRYALALNATLPELRHRSGHAPSASCCLHCLPPSPCGRGAKRHHPSAHRSPSESDLDLPKIHQTLRHPPGVLDKHPGIAPKAGAWGSGWKSEFWSRASPKVKSLIFSTKTEPWSARCSYSFRPRSGPYKTLRYTLSRLKPSLEFYLTVAQLADRQNMASSTLYDTGDEKTTTRYLVLGDPTTRDSWPRRLPSIPTSNSSRPIAREFLDRLRETAQQDGGQHLDTQGRKTKEPFTSLQQFARGQTAQLAYCGTKTNRSPSTRTKSQCFRIHQSGLAGGTSPPSRRLLGSGRQPRKGQSELLPRWRNVRNSRKPSITSATCTASWARSKMRSRPSEKAVLMRPNYAIARFNLAEAIADANPKRAITGIRNPSGTYRGNPRRGDRSALAQSRVKALKHQ